MWADCWIIMREHWSRHVRWWIRLLSRAWLSWHCWCMRYDDDSEASNMRRLISDSWYNYRIQRVRNNILSTWSNLSATACRLLLLLEIWIRKRRRINYCFKIIIRKYYLIIIILRVKIRRRKKKKRIYFKIFKSSFSDMIIKKSLLWIYNKLWIQMRRIIKYLFWKCLICLNFLSFR